LLQEVLGVALMFITQAWQTLQMELGLLLLLTLVHKEKEVVHMVLI
jgi:hypothetical protein